VVETFGALEALGPDPAAAEEMELTWIAFELKDQDGNPVKNRAFELTLPDGSKEPGKLDEYGKGGMNRIPRGSVKFAFVDMAPRGRLRDG
jgi:hypothetical protein